MNVAPPPAPSTARRSVVRARSRAARSNDEVALREHLTIRPEDRRRALAMQSIVEVAHDADDGDQRIRRVILALTQVVCRRRIGSAKALATPSVMIATRGASSRSASVNARPCDERNAERSEVFRADGVEAKPRIRAATRRPICSSRRETSHPHVGAEERRHSFGRNGHDARNLAQIRHHPLVRREIRRLRAARPRTRVGGRASPPFGWQSSVNCRHGNEKLSIVRCSVA